MSFLKNDTCCFFKNEKTPKRKKRKKRHGYLREFFKKLQNFKTTKMTGFFGKFFEKNEKKNFSKNSKFKY